MTFRKEEKLNIHKNQLLNLLDWIIENDGYKLYEDRLVSSTYFDNDNMQMFKDSEEGSVPRKKIRIRSYSSQEHKKGSCALEIKRSSIEGRFKISSKSVDPNKYFRHGYFDSDYGIVKPRARVSYKRSYYSVLNVRLTIDRNIEYSKVDSLNRETYKATEKDLIVEVKADNHVSIEYLHQNFNFDRIRFSKYSKAINAL